MEQSRQEIITALVRNTYENPRVVSRYVELGLWPAEEILILDYVPSGARLLDVGCGAGRTSIPLAEMGLDVIGIDLSQTMIAIAGQQARLNDVRVEFRQMDVIQLDFPDASFDAALFSYNGVELLPGRQGKLMALKEIHRAVKPGGIIIFCSHSLFALNSYAPFRVVSFLRLCASRMLGFPCKEKELGERFIDDPEEEVRYLQILPPAQWIGMLREVGFELVYFNTRKRIESGRSWKWSGLFEDGERFYVGRKQPF